MLPYAPSYEAKGSVEVLVSLKTVGVERERVRVDFWIKMDVGSVVGLRPCQSDCGGIKGALGRRTTIVSGRKVYSPIARAFGPV